MRAFANTLDAALSAFSSQLLQVRLLLSVCINQFNSVCDDTLSQILRPTRQNHRSNVVRSAIDRRRNYSNNRGVSATADLLPWRYSTNEVVECGWQVGGPQRRASARTGCRLVFVVEG